jgi:hypothetical protein
MGFAVRGPSMEIAMKIRLITASLMLFVSGAAFAAEEFYVVQNPKTKSCKIPTKKMTARMS